jgi:hypothetical protein
MYDINVLVTAVASGTSPLPLLAVVTPHLGNACADCVGIIVDTAEFALCLSNDDLVDEPAPGGA